MASTKPGSAPAEPVPLPKPQVSVSQLRILLAAVEKDPSLYKDAKSDMISVLNIKKWQNLSNKLNECLDNTMLNTPNWKRVLRYWADNVNKGVDVMSKERLAFNKANPAITLKEAKELTRLERRFYNFLKKVDAKETEEGNSDNFGADQAKSDIAEASDNDENLKVHLMNVFPLTDVNDENVCPNGPNKRPIHVNEDNTNDRADVTKKLEITFDENLDDEEAENKQILALTLERLQMVSRELENHIASIQRRIDMIKDMKKHLGDDN